MAVWIVSAALLWLVAAGAAALLLGRGLTTCEARERLAEPADPQPQTHRPAPRPRPRQSRPLAGGRRAVVVAQPAHSHR